MNSVDLALELERLRLQETGRLCNGKEQYTLSHSVNVNGQHRKMCNGSISDTIILTDYICPNSTTDLSTSPESGMENHTEKVFFAGCKNPHPLRKNGTLEGNSGKMSGALMQPSFAFHYWPPVTINNITRVSARAAYSNRANVLFSPVNDSDTGNTNISNPESPRVVEKAPENDPHFYSPSELPSLRSDDLILSVPDLSSHFTPAEDSPYFALINSANQNHRADRFETPLNLTSSNTDTPSNGALKSMVYRQDKKCKKLPKSVHFADSNGRCLVEIREFSESQELLDQIKKDALMQEQDGNVPVKEKRREPLFKFDFSQPASNYLSFRQKLESALVSLENAYFNGSRHLCGTVKVKNLSFEKKVYLRITYNSWDTCSDVKCSYVDNGLNIVNAYDTFRFEADIPASWYAFHKIEFCVCYVENNIEHWDNNSGHNYAILANTPQIHASDRASNVTSRSTLFSYWRANSAYDQHRPYW